METGRIFHVQRFSIQDGPGIRTTVFLKGCALACAWCHNPEGRSAAAEIVRIEERCVACGETTAASATFKGGWISATKASLVMLYLLDTPSPNVEQTYRRHSR